MLYSSLILLVVALVAGVLGFTGPASAPALRVVRAASLVLLAIAIASLAAGSGLAR